jgi:hypothetical protein
VDVIDLATREVATVATSKGVSSVAIPSALSPDGKTLAVMNVRSRSAVQVATLSPANPNGEVTPLLGGPVWQVEPSFSRDGTSIALSETPPGGAEEINIRPFPDASRTRIPVGQGTDPVFSRDGSELFYDDRTGIKVAHVSYEPTLHVVGTPEPLFASPAFLWNLYGRTWDPDPSGKRFLMIHAPDRPVMADIPARIDVVLNWGEELESRLHAEH